jgi:predicted nucleic acid-binding protein
MNLLEADKEHLQELLNAVALKEYEEVCHYTKLVEVLGRRDPKKEKKIDILQTWIAQISNAIGLVEAREKSIMN